MSVQYIRAIKQHLAEVTIHEIQLPQFNRCLCFALSFLILGFTGSAYAETCRKQIVNGKEVIICCDGNGVCYNK
jgi:hypothetical protein